ncbi:hypothetical protein MATL_G00260770 [Megalops atlanticus]|uniref:Myb-like domain-containing protein n=1 Tax=Megalops atlanticus TaxID=7932 RepID=A0A9D3SZP8_MEGAT|nr:hypothetical protein MATL_G00260770 [Megalops atlanticus]
MEAEHFSEDNRDAFLPLSSLRLLAPPLRLASAAMWQVAQRKDVMRYGELEEFVSLVTETVPELLTYRQRVQLILGLRARLILELCRGEHPADTETIQHHLARFRTPVAPPLHSEMSDTEVEVSEANFLELVQTLLKDPVEREHFFQEVFPVEYGPQYDTALQILMSEFLSRLEQLLPVPDCGQIVYWLSAAPSGVEECLHSVSDPQQLKMLLQHHRCLGHLDRHDAVSTMGDCILSSLSLPPIVRVVIATEQINSDSQSESVRDSILSPAPEEFTTMRELQKDRLVNHKRKRRCAKVCSVSPIIFLKEGNTGASTLLSDGSKCIPWTERETLVLINIWGKDKIQRNLKDCTRNRHIFAVISRKMAAQGFFRTPEQCQSRIKRLKWSFRQCSDGNRSECKFYDQLERIIGNKTHAAAVGAVRLPEGTDGESMSDSDPATDSPGAAGSKKIPWTNRETRALIDIWGEEDIQWNLKNCLRNRHIFELISKRICDRGYSRTAEQCQTRIKRLKLRFRQCFDNNKDGGKKVFCKFYNELQQIIMNKPLTTNAVDVCSGSVGESTSAAQECMVQESAAGSNQERGAAITLVNNKTNDIPCGTEQVKYEIYDHMEPITGFGAGAVESHGDIAGALSEVDSAADSDLERAANKPKTDGAKKIPWTNQETRVLIDVWGQEDIQQNLKGCYRNGHVFTDISKRMSARGYSRTAEQCQMKVKRLKASFHQCVEANSSGREQVMCKFYHQLERILGNKPLASSAVDLCSDGVGEPSSAGEVSAAGEFVAASDLKEDSQGAVKMSMTDRTNNVPWSKQETLLLIDLWGEDEFQENLKGCIKNRHLFTQISKKMAARGYSRTPQQCQSRVKRLKTSFRQCSDSIASGREPMEFKYYHKLERILGKELLTAAPLAVDSNNDTVRGTTSTAGISIVEDSTSESDMDSDSQGTSITVVDGSNSVPWSEQETLTLIDIWGEDKIQRKLKACIKNRRIFVVISRKMFARGYPRTPEQCQSKIKRLRLSFLQCSSNCKSGQEQKECKFYDQLKRILGNKPVREASAGNACSAVEESTAGASMADSAQQRAGNSNLGGSRAIPWTDQEAQVLSEIWGEDEVQQSLKDCPGNRHVFAVVSKKMFEKGYTRTPEQCLMKVAGLKLSLSQGSDNNLSDREGSECSKLECINEVLTTVPVVRQDDDTNGETPSTDELSTAEASAGAASIMTDGTNSIPWSEQETLVFLDHWGEDEFQKKLKGCIKNGHVYAQISKKMAARGYSRTPQQCQSRMKRLKTSFHRRSASIASGKDRSEFKFYSKLEHILGNELLTAAPLAVNSYHDTVRGPSSTAEVSTLEESTYDSDKDTGSQGAASITTTDGTNNIPWSEHETLILLDLWGEDDFQKNLKGCFKNGHLFAQISNKMAAQGYPRTPRQCQTRVKRLKSIFRQCSDNIANGREPMEFKFYNKLERILGNEFHTTAPSVAQDDDTKAETAEASAVGEPASDSDMDTDLKDDGLPRIHHSSANQDQRDHIYSWDIYSWGVCFYFCTGERSGQEQKECKFYNQLKRILGNKPVRESSAGDACSAVEESTAGASMADSAQGERFSRSSWYEDDRWN